MPWSQAKNDHLKAYGLLVIWSPVIVIAAPWLLWSDIRHTKRQKKRQANRQQRKPSPPPPEPPLRPLPAVRPRRLTDVGSNHPQLQSALITRIPFEVRLMIWEQLLGRKTDKDVLHLDLVDGSLGHVRCYESQPCCKLGCNHHCWGVFSRPSWRVNWERKDAERKLQSILLTCKLIYRETVGILYRSNTFDMRSSDSIYRLSRVILPQRFQQIRSIRFSTTFRYFISLTAPQGGEIFACRTLSPPDVATMWPEACQILASMKHLEDVEVLIMFWNCSGTPGLPPQDELLTSTLAPLTTVRARKYSVVVQKSLIGRVQRLLGPLPFQLVPYVQPPYLSA